MTGVGAADPRAAWCAWVAGAGARVKGCEGGWRVRLPRPRRALVASARSLMPARRWWTASARREARVRGEPRRALDEFGTDGVPFSSRTPRWAENHRQDRRNPARPPTRPPTPNPLPSSPSRPPTPRPTPTPERRAGASLAAVGPKTTGRRVDSTPRPTREPVPLIAEPSADAPHTANARAARRGVTSRRAETTGRTGGTDATANAQPAPLIAESSARRPAHRERPSGAPPRPREPAGGRYRQPRHRPPRARTR
jgi:hypothetical protein